MKSKTKKKVALEMGEEIVFSAGYKVGFKEGIRKALEVVGEDEYTTYLPDVKYRECPQCQAREVEYHKPGCRTMEEMLKNRVRQQIRTTLQELLK